MHRKAQNLLVPLLAASAISAAHGAPCLIQSKQVGGVRAGMTVTQARSALPGAVFKTGEDGDHMPIHTVWRATTRLMDLYVDVDEPRPDRARIELIRVYDPACATAQGVHPGMPLGDVEKHYGKLLRLERTEVEAREYAEFENAPSWMDIQCGNGKAGIYPSGKRCASTFAPAAKVESLWISHPRTSTRFFATDAECSIQGK